MERTAESARRLLDAAIELIAEKGFERTTVAEIGERAGYSRSMVRARYGSKEALLESIFAQELDRRLMPVEDSDIVGLDWVLARVDHVADLLEEQRALMRAISMMSLEAGIAIGSLRAWYQRWLADYERQMADQLRAGQETGTIRADLVPEDEAADFVTHGFGLVFRWMLDPDGYDLGAQLTRWRARLERSFTSRPSR